MEYRLLMNIDLPVLTANRLFMQDLMDAEPSCFALGLVEEDGVKSGFLAIRPQVPLPDNSKDLGFCFGHSVLEYEGSPIFQFVFKFFGHAVYHGLFVPGNPIVQVVLETITQTNDYLFLSLNSDNSFIAFRSQMNSEDLEGLKSNLDNFGDIKCTSERYERAVKAFTRNPDPEGQVMEWVCRNNWQYLDLTKHRLELNPTK